MSRRLAALLALVCTAAVATPPYYPDTTALFLLGAVFYTVMWRRAR